MLACDASLAPDDFASDKSYFGQLCLAGRGAEHIKRCCEATLLCEAGWRFKIISIS
jgi:hypothetical protein